ncbi:MAG: toll/interleukin-1 receptor domain-containing protein, partial [Thermoanaerobaculia bacterium]
MSYARQDEAWALWTGSLLNTLGFTVELDKWSWKAGDDFTVNMNAALDNADIIAAIFSQSYFDPAHYSSLEGATAQAFLISTKKRVVLLIVDDTVPPPLLQSRIPLRFHNLTHREATTLLQEGFTPLLEDRDPISRRVDTFELVQSAPFPGRTVSMQDESVELYERGIRGEISATAAGSLEKLSRLRESESEPLYIEQADLDASDLGRTYLHRNPAEVFRQASRLEGRIRVEIAKNRNPEQLRD